MTSDLDALINEDPLKLTRADIDKIIIYMRQTLAQSEGKAQKPERPKVDLSSARAALIPQVEKPKLRRI